MFRKLVNFLEALMEFHQAVVRNDGAPLNVLVKLQQRPYFFLIYLNFFAQGCCHFGFWLPGINHKAVAQVLEEIFHLLPGDFFVVAL